MRLGCSHYGMLIKCILTLIIVSYTCKHKSVKAELNCSENMEFEKYMKLGLEGKELLDFIRQMEKEARDERQKERDHQKAIKEFELNIAKSRENWSVPEGSASAFGSSTDTLPKLPKFQDGKDDIDAFLKRFERYAKIVGWNRDNWSVPLSALLTGRALEVYIRMPDDQSSDYDKLRDALLRRYQLNEEGFRQKFRRAKLQQGETYSQFADRIKGYFTRWAEMGTSAKTYDELMDLMVREQTSNVCPRDLALFLKERNPKSVKEMTKLADRYQEAHRPSGGSTTGGEKSKVQNKSEGNPRQHDETLLSRTCYNCQGKGHIARDCPSPKATKTARKTAASMKSESNSKNSKVGKTEEVERDKSDSSTSNSVSTNFASGLENKDHVLLVDVVSVCNDMPVCEGRIGSEVIQVLRDSGCSTVVVRKKFVTDKSYTGRMQKCVLIDGTVREVPIARLFVDTPFYKGDVDALVFDSPIYDLILGNIPGVRQPLDPDSNWEPEDIVSDKQVDQSSGVQTREQKQREQRALDPLLTSSGTASSVTKHDIGKAQNEDKSLSRLWELGKHGTATVTKTGNEILFVVRNKLLYRKFKSVNSDHFVEQLVVPKKYTSAVMKLAHESPLAGHLGTKKTTDRILAQFYWPGMHEEIRRFCISCDICQRTVDKGRVPKAPLGVMPLIDTPFRRVAIDLVGPIYPATDRGNRYILTLVDFATRYPEAVPLKQIDTERVAEALLDIFTRVGVPNEILSDMGKQFTSDLMKAIGRLLTIRPLTTTPYHPQCNGLVERFNGTLKRMLRRMCAERPKDWDRYLSAILFAYREVPQESLGFSPFELLYGRSLRGPMTVLKELWTGEVDQEEVKHSYQYVVDLRERLEDTCRMAQEELKRSSQRYRKYFDARTKDRQFKAGDLVLILLPTDANKILAQWQGPYEIVGKVGRHDYRVKVKGKEKTLHVNLLKKYIQRQDISPDAIIDTAGAGTEAEEIAVNVIEDNDEYKINDECSVNPNIQAKESFGDVHINSELDTGQKESIQELMRKYSDILTDLPGCTDIIEHKIMLTTNVPLRSKPYGVPHAMVDEFQQEIENMIKMGIIERSDSPYASPVVLVRKKDGSIRFCVDFRKLNAISLFDPEPIPSVDELLVKIANGQYFTKIDLSKGYWQVKIANEDKPKTAFITQSGLYQFNMMPFGLINAPALFTRMMRRVLDGIQNVVNYIDDILIYTETFEHHLKVLEIIMHRLREVSLHARPTKCFAGYTSLEFLGFTVGPLKLLQPTSDKVNKILEVSRPCTKKQVRSFLGMVGYYRRFVPNFATISAPLSDLTRKGKPNKVEWENAQETAFTTLKARLASSPILKLPDVGKSFILRTDASDVGVGAVLLQKEDDELYPVFYASRKLLPRECKYSVVEKECLALVWAVKKFNLFLYGREFLIETDHFPLARLSTAQLSNPRVMRWALGLQPYRYLVKTIKGTENFGADFLSRCPKEDSV